VRRRLNIGYSTLNIERRRKYRCDSTSNVQRSTSNIHCGFSHHLMALIQRYVKNSVLSQAGVVGGWPVRFILPGLRETES